MRCTARAACLLACFLLFPVRAFTADEVSDAAGYFFRIGDWKRAVKAYANDVETESPPEELRKLAESYFHLGSYKEAEKTIRKALQKTDDIPYQVLLLLIQARKGKAEAVIDKLEKLLPHHSGESLLHTALGMVEMERDPEKALSHFREAAATSEHEFWAWFYIGEIYERRENFDEAIRAYRRALDINPDFAQAVNNLGYCYKEKHYYAYAIEQYQGAIELIPDRADYHYNIGNAYTMEEMFDDALAAYKTAVELEPTFAKAHYNLGRAYVQKGMFEDAVREFKLYLRHGNDYTFRYVAAKKSVQDEIESLEMYLRFNKPYR